MAVYTPVDEIALARWLQQFDAGELYSLTGIVGGIENTNYFVSCARGEFVLTLFERLTPDELPFYLELMRHLAARGVLCPAPQATASGQLFAPLEGKPAALVTRLAGHWQKEPTPAALQQTAEALARMHLAGRDFPLQQPNPRGPAWWKSTLPLVAPHLSAELEGVLRGEVHALADVLESAAAQLPRGPIHADLFRDNVLFSEDRLCGFIDFYFAGCDAWLFDVAVCVNDWCVVPDSGALRIEQAALFLTAYSRVRPFTAAEAELWPDLLRAAALRFWLSRLADLIAPRNAALLVPHNPRQFERIVLRRRSEAAAPLVPLPVLS